LNIDLSIVTTLYYSQPHLQEFYERASRAAGQLTNAYEIILVNDGSPDDSLPTAVSLQKKDPHVVVVDLSRNFGHHRALMTGLSYARGNTCFLIDCDLEEKPEWLALFEKILRNENGDVAYGVQERRKGQLFERWTGMFFYKLFNFLSSTPIPANQTTARLMSRRYVKGLLRHHETEVFIPGLWQLTGFHQIAVPVQKHSSSATTYSLGRKIALFVNAITSFSDKPLVYTFYTGTLICLGAGMYVVWLLYLKIQWGNPLLGWPSLIVSIWFLGGLTIFFIGVLGIYLSRVYREIKQRPYSIVRNVFPFETKPAGD
jgi:putative glycosyltransferase